jgi:hypothetical protein
MKGGENLEKILNIHGEQGWRFHSTAGIKGVELIFER